MIWVDFIFDDEGEKNNVLRYWELIKINSAPEFAQWTGDAPVYRDDRTTPPLQAADLYAWWILKWEREGLEDWVGHLPFPWGIKRDIRRLAMSFSVPFVQA